MLIRGAKLTISLQEYATAMKLCKIVISVRDWVVDGAGKANFDSNDSTSANIVKTVDKCGENAQKVVSFLVRSGKLSE